MYVALALVVNTMKPTNVSAATTASAQISKKKQCSKKRIFQYFRLKIHRVTKNGLLKLHAENEFTTPCRF